MRDGSTFKKLESEPVMGVTGSIPNSTDTPDNSSDRKSPVKDNRNDPVSPSILQGSSPEINSVTPLSQETQSQKIAALMFAIGNDKRPHTNVLVMGRFITALVDTGAQMTAVGINHFTCINDWGETLEQCPFTIHMADQSSQRPLGQVSVKYQWEGITRSVPTIILDRPTTTLILGMDFLRQFNIGSINIAQAITSVLEPVNEASIHLSTIPVEVNTVTTNEEGNTEAILSNRIITAEGHDDTELDIEPPKISPVTVPHLLTVDQQEVLDKVLKLFTHTILEGELSRTTAIEHIIDTGDAKPIMKRQYPMSPIQLEKVKKELDKMAALGIVTEIKYSPWRSPILAVNKKDGGVRVCLDARELNKVTVPNAYPIVDTNSILAQLKTTKFMSSIDLSQAFHQVPLAVESQEKTAFAIGGRMMCYKRMTMGLRNSPATLAILIDQIFRDLHPYAFAYVDDFIICTETFDHHIQVLTTIAHRLADFGLTISPSKSNFCCKQLEFLGYILTEEGLSANPTRVDAIRQFPRPTSVKEVRRFIGAAGWYRRFIHRFAEIVAPLTALTSKNKKSIDWSESAEMAFNSLKDHLSSPPILAMCNYSKPFKIYTDASDVAGAAILVQEFEDGEKPLCYYSFKFTDTQQRYCATERECLAVIASVEKFRPYIEGSKFEVITDHSALQWLMNTKDRKGRLSRWAFRMQGYVGDMTFVHRKGSQMELPDALSRTIPPNPVTNVNVISIDPKSDDNWYRRTFEKASKDQLDRYKVENGLLYYRSTFDSYSGERMWILCVPKEQRDQVLKEHHDDYSHMGIWKVLRRIRPYYYWPGMSEYIFQYIRNCTTCRCAKSSNENTNTPIGKFRDPGTVGQTLSIDLVGEWPISKYGNRYIFVVIDCFSKFVWVKTLRRMTATAIIAFMEKEIFPSNGCPKTILSDNGTQFTSHCFAEMCERHKIDHRTTPRCHPQANPVEATNKTIKYAMRTYLATASNHSGWEDFLPKIIADMNSTPHSATNRTPQFIHFGRELVRHGSEYQSLVDANPPRDNDIDRQALITEETRDRAADVYGHRREKHNRTAKKRSFKEGAIVYVPNLKLSNKAAKYNQKLAPAKIQARIKKRVGEDTYLVTDLNGKELGKIHANDIYMHSIEGSESLTSDH